MTTKMVSYRLSEKMIERIETLAPRIRDLPEYKNLSLTKNDVFRIVLDEGIAELTLRIMMQDEIAESKPRLLAPVA